MLFLEDKKISAKELCEKFGIDLLTLKKHPVFEMDIQWHKDGKRPPERVTFPAKCFVRDKATGGVLELRYAETRGTKVVKNEKIDTFKPRNIVLESVKNRVSDEDKLVYMFLNPDNGSSPLSNGKNPIYHHVDPSIIAANRMKKVNATKRAMDAIEAMSDTDLVIFAKGFQASYKDEKRPFNPFVDGAHTDVQVVRVGMMEFCSINPQAVVDLIDNQLGKLRGQIINLIDNRIVVEDASTGVRQWRWAKGERQGQPVGNQILDPHSDSRDYLLSYLQSNLSEYMTLITTITQTDSAEQAALNYLALQKENENKINAEVSYDGLPSSYAECQEWLSDNGFKKTPALAKKLNDGIQSKQVHTMNIKNMAEQYTLEIAQSYE